MRVPSIVTWNRLEGRPRSEDFERSLRTEVRDPLWMLTRQWQVGELTAMDGGTPVLVRVETRTEELAGFVDAAGVERVTRPDVPLETRAEAEPTPRDLATRVRRGEAWLRTLKAHVGDDRYRALFAGAYPIPELADENPRVAQWRSALRRRAVDGVAFLDDVRGGRAVDSVEHDGRTVAVADKPAVSRAAEEFLGLERTTFEPDASERTWVPERLEYQFGVRTGSADGSTALAASEYHGGQLDWYAFEIADETATRTPTTTKRTYLPTPVTFAGMPSARWWEIEDTRVDFGSVDVQTTDIATLLLLEFGLTYANDWSVIALPVRTNTLCRITSLVSKDVFGQETDIPAAHTDGSTWSMFELSGPTRSSALFVPAVVAQSREGEPIEQVDFMRDEMANLVWGVETSIPDDLGGAIRRSETERIERTRPTEDLRYRLIGTVPTHWIPFVPTRIAGSNREIQLQRGTMPGPDGVPVAPRGELLRPHQGPYFVHEEEIGRAGTRITRRWQRARSHTGRVFLWLGRQRTTAVAEASSGLRFDEIVG